MRALETRPGMRPVSLRRGRVGWLCLLAVVLVAGAVWVDLARLASAGEDTGDHVVIGVVLTVLAALVAAGMLTLGARLPQWEVFPDGIALWSYRGAAEVPWDQVTAVALSHQRSRSSILPLRTGKAVEVFLRPGVDATDHPRAQALWTQGQPPRPTLSAPSLRMTSPGAGQAADLAAAVEDVVPGRWLGDYRR